MSLVDVIKQRDIAFTFAPMSQEYIQQAEGALNVSFSEEYANYLAEFGVAIFDGHEFTGLCDGKRLDVVKITQKQRELNNLVPNDWYVIEEADIDGIVIWQNAAGEVYQTLPGRSGVKIADSLSEYISK